MGMGDIVVINNNNELGLHPGVYHTQDLNLGLDSYLITSDGQIRLEKYGTSNPKKIHWIIPDSLPKKVTNISGILALNNLLFTYYLNVVNGKIVSLTDWRTWDSCKSEYLGIDMREVIYKDV